VAQVLASVRCRRPGAVSFRNSICRKRRVVVVNRIGVRRDVLGSDELVTGTELFANRQVVVADGWKAVSSQKVGIERVRSLPFCQASLPSKVNTVRAPTPA
jgi:hypothetical protein